MYSVSVFMAYHCTRQDIANIRRELSKTIDEIDTRRKAEENIDLWIKGNVLTGEPPHDTVGRVLTLSCCDTCLTLPWCTPALFVFTAGCSSISDQAGGVSLQSGRRGWAVGAGDQHAFAARAGVAIRAWAVCYHGWDI
jgi:hypothetical protein